MISVRSYRTTGQTDRQTNKPPETYNFETSNEEVVGRLSPFPGSVRASVAQRQSVGLGIERSRVRNSLVPSGFSLGQEKKDGTFQWHC